MGQYRVACECGRTHHVSGGLAGAKLPCECGRQVEVPQLRELRAAAGEPTAGPELVIESLLRDGRVPGEGRCACCGAADADLRHVQVDCEQTESSGRRYNPAKLIVYVLFGGWIGGFISLFAGETRGQERGRNVAYRLPVRVCRDCVRGGSRSDAVAVLQAVAEYRPLLAKYPHASIGRLE